MNPSITQLKEAYQNLAFIHQKLMASTFFPEDFTQADKSIKFLTEMANKISEDIEKSASETPSTEVVTEEVV